MKKKNLFSAVLGAVAITSIALSDTTNLPTSDQPLVMSNIEALSQMEDYKLICGKNEGTCWRIIPSGGCTFSGFVYDYCVKM